MMPSNTLFIRLGALTNSVGFCKWCCANMSRHLQHKSVFIEAAAEIGSIASSYVTKDTVLIDTSKQFKLPV